MAGPSLIPSGDYRTNLRGRHHDLSDHHQPQRRGLPASCCCALRRRCLSAYGLSILIQIGIFAIAALGLNILVGFTGTDFNRTPPRFFFVGCFYLGLYFQHAADPGVLLPFRWQA